MQRMRMRMPIMRRMMRRRKMTGMRRMTTRTARRNRIRIRTMSQRLKLTTKRRMWMRRSQHPRVIMKRKILQVSSVERQQRNPKVMGKIPP